MKIIVLSAINRQDYVKLVKMAFGEKTAHLIAILNTVKQIIAINLREIATSAKITIGGTSVTNHV